MPLLQEADAIYAGDLAADSVYLGDTLVWSSEFKLSSIPNMTLWYEVDDSPQAADGPINAQIPSRVGPLLHATASVRILMDSTGGHKALHFDPTLYGEQFLVSASPVALGPDFTVFVVVDAVSPQPSQHADLLDFDHGSGGWAIQQDGMGPGNYVAWRVGGSGQYSLANVGGYPGGPHIVEAYKNGGFVKISLGLTTGSTTGSAGLDTPGALLYVGNFLGGGRTFKGKISMVAGWNRALEPAELAQVRTYLTERWFPTSLDPDTQAYLNATGLDPSFAPALDGLVVGLKEFGLWNKMKAVYPFIGGTEALHRWNLIDPRDIDQAYRLTFTAGTHSTTLGYRPNLVGATQNAPGRADTHLIPADVLGDVNSTHLSLYSLADQVWADRCDMGCYNWAGTGSRFHIIGYYTSGEYYYGMSENGITSASGIGRSSGLFVSTRTAADYQAGYRNGLLNGSSPAPPSTGLPPVPVHIGGINYYQQGPSDLPMGFASIGNGLTATNVRDLYDVVQAYQTALGRAI